MSDGAGRYPASAMRASDADRDAVLTELGEHFQAGRLTSDELEERTGQALQAKTFGDLARLTADLPSPGSRGPTGEPAGGPPTRPGQVWPPVLLPLVLGLVAVAVVAGALAGGTGAGGSHLSLLIILVPLVAWRMASRRRR